MGSGTHGGGLTVVEGSGRGSRGESGGRAPLDAPAGWPAGYVGLSVGRVAELVADFSDGGFHGTLTLQFDAGRIVCAKVEQGGEE